MSKQLAEAVQRLADLAELQLQATRQQIARDDRREMAARVSTPEAQAEFEARRHPLRPISALAFIRAAPTIFAEAFDGVVPGDYYTQVDDGLFAVACPCGSEHHIDARGYPHGAECGRYFLYDGSMRVAFSPEAAATARPES